MGPSQVHVSDPDYEKASQVLIEWVLQYSTRKLF